MKHNAIETDRQHLSPELFSKFYTESGYLTPYALECGYSERAVIQLDSDPGNTIWHHLWKDGCYHVRQHNFATGERIFWVSFDTLTEARAFFSHELTKLKEQYEV